MTSWTTLPPFCRSFLESTPTNCARGGEKAQLEGEAAAARYLLLRR